MASSPPRRGIDSRSTIAAEQIQKAPRTFHGRKLRDISSPMEKANISLRKPPGRFQSANDQSTAR